MKNVKTAFVILAAGKGTRLGGKVPKPLTRLIDGRTILQQQLENIVIAFGKEALKQTFIVVGFKAEEILQELPAGVTPIYNEEYDTSNTSKSVLRALQAIPKKRGVLWMNGDVVFSPLVLSRTVPYIEQRASFMTIVEGRTDEEEMKYSLNEDGALSKVSKENTEGLGEAVGINFVAAADRPQLADALTKVDRNAYFEAGIERTLQFGSVWHPLPVTDLYAVEIDFAEDLVRANSVLEKLATLDSKS